MAIFRIYRDRSCVNDYLSETIHRIWDNKNAVARWNHGCTSRDSETIAKEFRLVHTHFAKLVTVQAHLFELEFNMNTDLFEIEDLAGRIVSEIGKERQVIAVMDTDNYVPRVVFFVNSVSYIDGSKWNDNNTNCAKLLDFIRSLNIWQWEIETGNNVFF